VKGLTALERAVSVFSPSRAQAMAGTRLGVAFAGQYAGARSTKTSLRNFNPTAGSADSDSIGDLPALRSRSRDLGRNAPIARGARNTSKTSIIGSGLRLRAVLQREVLGLTDAQAEEWEDRIEVLFDLWAKQKTASVDRKLNFYEMQAVAFTSAWDSGDCFMLRRFKESTSFLALCVQLMEADRVCTPNDRTVAQADKPEVRDGVEVDGDGEAIAYHVLNRHPGDDLLAHSYKPEDWARIPARGSNGLPLMVHLMDPADIRIGQTRGIPALAPVIEALKQLDRYAEAELMAAVVSAFFTVFIATEGNEGGGEGITGLAGVETDTREMALGSGTIIEGAPGEKPEIINPNRPNANFDPFFLAVIRQIGIALGIPYEVLIMHFSSSYTASKAAIETARQYFEDRRNWLATNACQPVYEWFLWEMVTRGIVKAPGFFDDPVKRIAWSGSTWIGRAPIVLDSKKDADAAEKWIDLGVETVESTTIAKNGGDWWRNQEQRKREQDLRTGFEPAVPQPAKPEPIKSEKESEDAGA
jgi:lambda family phage portal protein